MLTDIHAKIKNALDTIEGNKAILTDALAAVEAEIARKPVLDDVVQLVNRIAADNARTN